MKVREPLTDEYGEVRELTEEDFALARPLAEVMPPEFVQMVLAHEEEQKRKRGKQKKPTKQSVTIRLSQDVVEAFRATGQGWQTRIDDALRQYIQSSM